MTSLEALLGCVGVYKYISLPSSTSKLLGGQGTQQLYYRYPKSYFLESLPSVPGELQSRL